MTIHWELEEQSRLLRLRAHLQVRTVVNEGHHKYPRRYRLAAKKAQEGKHTAYGVWSPELSLLSC